MCVAPITLPEHGPVACRNCWQCRANRINDWVGRCIAEAKVSTDVLAVTLTYDDVELAKAGKEAHAVTLVYKDVQDFLKRLRKDYDVRYIVAGEYGSKKGRAHWHAVLFFKGNAPQVKREARIRWQPWHLGRSYFERPDYEGFAYILKYIVKDQRAQVATGHLGMSKKPPLGHEWIMAWADHHVAQKLAPSSPIYVFNDQHDRKGKRRKFWLQGRTREMFVERFQERWRLEYGTEPPYTEFLETEEDKQVRRQQAEYIDDLIHWETRQAEYLAELKRSLHDGPPRPESHEKFWSHPSVIDAKDVKLFVRVVQPGHVYMAIKTDDGDKEGKWRVGDVEDAKKVLKEFGSKNERLQRHLSEISAKHLARTGVDFREACKTEKDRLRRQMEVFKIDDARKKMGLQWPRRKGWP